MKRCPQCQKTYTEADLNFCLDDGEWLVDEGISDEPKTIILNEPAVSSEAATRAQIHTTEQTAVLPAGAADQPKKGLDKRLLLAPIVLAVIVLGGFFGYKYLLPSAKQIDSIAVMPFVNEGKNEDVEYLSDGMTETLINSLSQIPNLSVKARSTVFYYKGKEVSPQKIGEELKVQAILNGRVVQRGNDLILYLSLVDVKTGDQIWGETYNRKQSDLVTLQSDIARDVSSKLKIKLSGADVAKVEKNSKVDPEAYQLYLRGRFYWNKRGTENIKKAIEQLKSATEKDPNFALAYAGLADCYALLPDDAGIPASENAQNVRSFAERAIALDPQLAEPHATLGILNIQMFHWADAEKEAKRAVELNPNYPTGVQWYASILLDFGRYDESLAMYKRAVELDPLSGPINDGLSEVYTAQKNYEAAISNMQRFIELDSSFPGAYHNLGLLYLKTGRTKEGVSALEKAVELGNREGWHLSDLGYGYAVSGRRAEALAILKEMEDLYARNQAAGRYVAAVCVGLGDKDKAFEWLGKDLVSKRGRLSEIRWTIPFDPIRDDPRFKDLLNRMGLPE